MVQYVTFDISDEESIDAMMVQIDNLVQYDEFRLPKESMIPDVEGNDENEGDGDGSEMIVT